MSTTDEMNPPEEPVDYFLDGAPFDPEIDAITRKRFWEMFETFPLDAEGVPLDSPKGKISI
jgi:hypothetical protein